MLASFPIYIRLLSAADQLQFEALLNILTKIELNGFLEVKKRQSEILSPFYLLLPNGDPGRKCLKYLF